MWSPRTSSLLLSSILLLQTCLTCEAIVSALFSCKLLAAGAVTTGAGSVGTRRALFMRGPHACNGVGKFRRNAHLICASSFSVQVENAWLSRAGQQPFAAWGSQTQLSWPRWQRRPGAAGGRRPCRRARRPRAARLPARPARRHRAGPWPPAGATPRPAQWAAPGPAPARRGA